MLWKHQVSSLPVSKVRARMVALMMAGAAMLGVTASQSYAEPETMVFWDFNVPGESGVSTGTTVPVIDMTGGAQVQLIGGVIGSSFGNGFVIGDSSTQSFPNNKSSDPASKEDNSALMATNYPAQGTGNKTAGFEFSFNALQYSDITLSFDMLVQNSASRYQQLQYSLDGGAFVDVATIDVFEAWFFQTYAENRRDWILDYTFEFGTLLDNAASVDIRLVTQFAPDTNEYEQNGGVSYGASTGQIRLDMVRISGVTSPLLIGDANLDDLVDDLDLVILQSNLGLSGAGWTDGDFSGNGIVDLYDAYLLFQNYQPTASMVTAIPEPATALSLLLGGLVLIGRPGRRVESRPPLQNGAISE